MKRLTSDENALPLQCSKTVLELCAGNLLESENRSRFLTLERRYFRNNTSQRILRTSNGSACVGPQYSPTKSVVSSSSSGSAVNSVFGEERMSLKYGVGRRRSYMDRLVGVPINQKKILERSDWLLGCWIVVMLSMGMWRRQRKRYKSKMKVSAVRVHGNHQFWKNNNFDLQSSLPLLVLK